jgi:hypothetical protein
MILLITVATINNLMELKMEIAFHNTIIQVITNLQEDKVPHPFPKATQINSELE